MKTLSVILALLVSPLPLAADTPGKSKQIPSDNPSIVAGLPRWTLLNTNNVTTWMRSDGQSNRSPTGINGAFYPRGTVWTIYQDGFVWGAKPYLDSNYIIPAPWQNIRVGGATYNIGTRQGWVIGQGATAVPVDPSHPDARMFRVRRDYAEMNFEDLKQDASEFFEIPVSEVNHLHMTAIRSQYHTDWSAWPVQYGAPYIERNGIPGFQAPPPFGPGFTVDSLIAGRYDEPGIAGSNRDLPADQVLWTVFNDLDSATTVGLYGSYPLGLEVQVTVWGYRRPGAIGQTYFKRLRLINKGGVTIAPGQRGSFYIDSVHIAQWSDADLGHFADDLVGCDTILQLAYVYNGRSRDTEYFRAGLVPPAFAYALAQGPLVPGAPGDSGIFNFRRVYGMTNRPLTSFGYTASGSGAPFPPGTYEGALRWWKWLHGYVPDVSGPWRRYPHPPGEPISAFPLNGDPVTGVGFVDGLGTAWSLAPGDRSIVLTTSAFRLAPGDTQEVVLAAVGGIGSTHRMSVAAMKANAGTSVQALKSLLAVLPPLVSDVVTYPNSSEATVRLFVDARGTRTQSLQSALLSRSGAVVASMDLFDDGTHGDTLAGDNIWTNQITIPRQAQGLFVRLTGVDALAGPFRWDRIHERVTTVGPLEVRSPAIFADNINNDGRANPGENVRYGFTLVNATGAPLSSLVISPQREEERKSRGVASLPAGGVDSMIYIPTDDQSFFRVLIPESYADSLLTLGVTVTDNDENRWNAQLQIPVYPFASPVQTAVLNHIAGSATGELEILVVDPLSIRNHLYLIRGEDSLGGQWVGFTLKDSTDGRILLNRHPLPDSLGFNVPVTDGFRIRIGTLETRGGMRGWDVPAGTRRFSWVGGEGLGFGGFNGTIDWNDPAYYFGQQPSKGVSANRLRNVLLRLATAASGTTGNPNSGFPYGGWDRETTTDPNMSYAYRYVRAATSPLVFPEWAQFIVNPSAGYAYQDYKKGVPFSAWDIDTIPPRRLAVGFLENNQPYGSIDGLYWPPPENTLISNVQSTGPREWIFIFDAEYTGPNPNPAYTVNILNNSLPVMWWGTFTRAGGMNFFTGDEFRIDARKVMTAADRWTFNPTIVVGVGGELIPEEFALYQNYPNPFNPLTTVRYQLPVSSLVTLRIYNILGQEIRTLVQETLPAGVHSAVWDGRNNRGRAVASGVYFYRLEVRPAAERGSLISFVNKMLLIK